MAGKLRLKGGLNLQRLTRFDPTEVFTTTGSRLAAQLLWGIACGALIIGLRSLIDQLAPNVGPFALIYPAILLATLYGHWQAGVAAMTMTFLWAWWYVLPSARSFEVATPDEGWRIAINAASALVVLIFAEAFRRAVREATELRDKEIEHTRMLLAELDHRTKNNFQLMTSLLAMQKRREAEPAGKQALSTAIGRLHSFADVYSKMPVAASGDDQVSIGPYLTQIVDRVSRAVFHDHVKVSADIEDMALPREHAVALGLYANEALTNCAKHAFHDGRPGTVKVDFVSKGAGWELSIHDDGVGLKQNKPTRKGTGTSLMDAFAKQAHGEHTIANTRSGCSVRLRSARIAAGKARPAE